MLNVVDGLKCKSAEPKIFGERGKGAAFKLPRYLRKVPRLPYQRFYLGLNSPDIVSSPPMSKFDATQLRPIENGMFPHLFRIGRRVLRTVGVVGRTMVPGLLFLSATF